MESMRCEEPRIPHWPDICSTRSKAVVKIDLCFLLLMPPKRGRGRSKKRIPGFAKWQQDEKEVKAAASNASAPVQDTKPDAVTPAPPEPESAAQPKSRGRVKGDKRNTGQGTAATRETTVAQEGQSWAQNDPRAPKEAKFVPETKGMYLRPAVHANWSSTALPKANPAARRADEKLKQAEEVLEDQKCLASATTAVWNEMQQQLGQHRSRCNEPSCNEPSCDEPSCNEPSCRRKLEEGTFTPRGTARPQVQVEDLALMIASHMPSSFLNTTEVPNTEMSSELNRRLRSKIARLGSKVVGLEFKLQGSEAGRKAANKQVRGTA